ncbi:MAG: hypothetical protein E7242_10290 [Lachnospiraceae bacterium]|nr:hypothetical protein [Lachnospiraceae bacterium]
MRKVFKVLIGFALVFALSVPMALVGSGEVKADDDVKVYINETNFPDENFRAYVSTLTGNEDSKGKYFTQEQINSIVSINCSEKNIESLKGIEHFTALTNLDCSYNQITSMDLTKNTALQTLLCYNNQMTSLDLSKNTALKALFCKENQITSMDLTKNTALQTLKCGKNQLTSMDLTKNTALTGLDCCYNQITSLDLTKNTALIYLDCSDNQITSMDLTKNTALTNLYCSYNQITSMDLTKNTALENLDCSYNQITSMDLTKNTALQTLKCGKNQITSLDLSNNNSLPDDSFQGGNQTTLADLIIKDKHTSLDMKAVMASGADIANVTITSDNWELDNTTGIASYTGTDFPKELSYTYDTNNGTKKLEVAVSFEAGKYAPTAAEYKYSKESGKPLTISFKRETCDSETFWMFKDLKLDGQSVDEKYFKLSKGSLNVELAAEFLDSLDNGEHTLSVSFIDGGEASATFTIAEKEAVNTDTSTSADITSANATAQTSQTPQTGDDSALIVYFVIGALAAVGGAMIVASNKCEEE